MNMKIIFLDFDGVLNSQKHFVKNHELVKEYCNINQNKMNDLDVMLERKMLDINLSNLENLVKIIKKTHAKVVVTSSWKILEIFPLICERLRRLGVPIIGVTMDESINRGYGIKQYLNENNVDNYIIIDDDIFPDYDDELLDHLIKTSFYEDGLNKELMMEAINLLNSKKVLVKKRKIY